MKRLRMLLVLAVMAGAGVVGITPRPALAVPVHPHLLFDSGDVSGINSRTSSGEPQKAKNRLILKANAYLTSAYDDPPTTDPVTGYYGGYWSKTTPNINQNKMGSILEDLAFAYKLTNDSRYADRAIGFMLGMSTIYNPPTNTHHNFPHWKAELGAGDLAKGMALAFDWTYDYMSTYDSVHGTTAIATIVNALIAEFPTLNNGVVEYDKFFDCVDQDWTNAHLVPDGHGPLETMNWGGVCGGGMGLLLLAIKDETCCTFPTGAVNTMLANAYNRVKNYMANTYGDGSGSNGTGGSLPPPDSAHDGDYTEGLGYAAYGAHNSLPFAFAWTHMGMNSTLVPGSGSDILAEAGTEGVDALPITWAFELEPGLGNSTIPRNDMNEFNWFGVESMSYFFKVRPDGLTGWLWDHALGTAGSNYFNDQPNPYNDEGNWSGTDPRHVSSEVAVILYYKNSTEIPRVDPSTVAGNARHYTDYGVVDMRSSFGATNGDVAVTFEAKRNHDDSKGHSQQDLGNFTIYAYGAKFVTDSGYGHTYPCQKAGDLTNSCDDPSDLTQAGMAIGHNVMLIANNTNQGTDTQSSAGHGLATPQTIPLVVDGANLTYLQSNLANAYSPAPYRATRNLVFSRASGEPVFIGVTDGLQRYNISNVKYEWRLNTDMGNTATVSTTAPQFTVAVGTTGPKMNGAVSALNPRTMLTQVNDPNLNQGPLGKSFRSVDSALTARLSIDHLALMAPAPAGITPPTVTTQTATGGNVIKGTWGTNSTMGWTAGTLWVSSRNPTLGNVSCTGFSSNGAFAKVSEGKGETVLDNGTFVAAGPLGSSHDYIRIGGTGAAATVVVSGSTVRVTGSTVGNQYTIWTPTSPVPQNITSIYINGTLFTGMVTHTGNNWVFTH